MPKISVLMPVYNTKAAYLKAAIESILNQTFSDFEFIIINDGSENNAEEVILSYTDKRIKYIKNKENIGLIKTLNKGLLYSKGEYIARMDSDDIALPERFKKQVEFMNENLNVGVCGTWLKTFGDDLNTRIKKYPSTSEEIKLEMLFSCPIAHPTAFIRKNLFVKYNLFYSEDYVHAEDYELWSRANKYFNFANIPESLVQYRCHKSQISQVFLKQQCDHSNFIKINQLENFKIIPSKEELYIHNKLSHSIYSNYSEIQLKNIESWLLKLINQNNIFNYYNQEILVKMLNIKWLAICKHAAKNGINTWKIFNNSKISGNLEISMINKVKFWIIIILGKLGCYKIYRFLKQYAS